MTRSDVELYEIEVWEWTEEEGFWHLRKTFDNACKRFPDVMEPYINRSEDLECRSEAKQFMRIALRETFSQRK
jgi:hypothetical protein